MVDGICLCLEYEGGYLSDSSMVTFLLRQFNLELSCDALEEGFKGDE